MVKYREPTVAGTFYPAEYDKLKFKLKELFKGLPEPRKDVDNKIKGAIVPHAGYDYSGKTAAKTYNKFQESKTLDTAILLGPSHSIPEVSASVWLGSDWATPLGRVEIDRELGEKIVNSIFNKNPAPHLEEHSLEVQLPFLQYIYEVKGSAVRTGANVISDSSSYKSRTMPKILPIAISVPVQIEICKKLADIISKAVKESGKNVTIIASSDFTHYGIGYHYLPFFGTDVEIKKSIQKLDTEAIKYIKEFRVKDFVNYVNDLEVTICGASAIAVLMFLMKNSEAKNVELLDYTTSGEITGNFKNSVSYAGIIFT